LFLTEKRKADDFDEINDFKKLKIIETKEEMEKEMKTMEQEMKKEMKTMEQEMKSMRINFINEIGRFINDTSNRVKQEFEEAAENYKRLADLKEEELE